VHRERGEDARVDLLGLRLQEVREATLHVRGSKRGAGADLQEGGRLLDERREMLVCSAAHCARADDLDRFLDRGELIRPQLLPILKIRRLLRARRDEIREVLFVGVARGCRVTEGTLVLSGPLKLRRLFLCLLFAVRRGSGDLRFQVLNEHLVRVAGVHLLFLEVSFLILELIHQLLQHVEDPRRLELVRVCLGRREVLKIFPELVALGKECPNDLTGFLRDEHCVLDLCEGGQLRDVFHLLFQRDDGFFQRFDRLLVLLVSAHVVSVFHFPHFGRGLQIALPNGDVLVELGNLLCEGRCIGLGFLDRRSELLDEAVCLLDRTLLFDRCVVAELLVRRELHLLLLLLLLALLEHPLEQLDDLLDRGNCCSTDQQQECDTHLCCVPNLPSMPNP
jgi:hypothetical protein